MISFIFPDAQDKVPRRSALGGVQTSNLGNISILAFPNLSLKVTEFDWNGNGNAEWGDHSVHAEQLSNFYRLMFSHEVCLIQSYDGIGLVSRHSYGGSLFVLPILSSLKEEEQQSIRTARP